LEREREGGKMYGKREREVMEDPHEMDKNEWHLIGLGRAMYTMANTTQKDLSLSKP
jgi:hypothetical protein